MYAQVWNKLLENAIKFDISLSTYTVYNFAGFFSHINVFVFVKQDDILYNS